MRLAATLCRALVIALAAAPVGSAAGPFEVLLNEGMLSIRARGASAPAVLAEVTKVTGVRFAIDPEAKLGNVDVEIGPVDPERAIRSFVGKIPGVAGSAASYASADAGAPRLTGLSLFGPGRASTGSPLRVVPAEEKVPLHPPDPPEQEEQDEARPDPAQQPVPVIAPTPSVEGRSSRGAQVQEADVRGPAVGA